MSILDNMVWKDPMRWHGLFLDIELSIYVLESYRTWLNMSPTEQLIFGDKYPEFEWMGNDLIKEMQHELLSVLN